MSQTVLLLEDEPPLVQLVSELLTEEDFICVHVTTVDELLRQAELRSPCVALLDSTNYREFDLWWLGPELTARGVPPLAFTAHSSAHEQFKADPRGFVGIVSKPFDAEQFIDLVNAICWEEHHRAAS